MLTILRRMFPKLSSSSKENTLPIIRTENPQRIRKPGAGLSQSQLDWCRASLPKFKVDEAQAQAALAHQEQTRNSLSDNAELVSPRGDTRIFE